MIFQLWSKRSKWTKWGTLDDLMKTLSPEEREAIHKRARKMLAGRKHKVRAMIWHRNGLFWRPRFLQQRRKSRIRRCALTRLGMAEEMRKNPKRRRFHVLRSKGWGVRLCVFARDCLNSWKTWL